MSETTSTSEGTHSNSHRCSHGRFRAGRALFWLLAAGGLFSLGWGVAHAGGPGRRCHGDVQSAAELRDHMGDRTDRALDRLDATDAQRSKVDAALDRLAPRLFALKAERGDLKNDLHDALAAPQVERSALEKVRKDALEAADEATALVADAAVEIGNALTQEQRQDLLDELERWHR